jgi:hypothetical protein
MTIHRGSRYEYADVVYYTKPYTGDKVTVVNYKFDDIGTITYEKYTWKVNDRLYLLAQEYYKNPTSWWIILEHNPEVKDPSNIAPGTVLRIPRVR